jgi:hypothetical protein
MWTKTFEAFFDFDEDAEVDDTGHFTFDFVSDFVFLNNFFFIFFLKIFSEKISLPSFGIAEMIEI